MTCISTRTKSKSEALTFLSKFESQLQQKLNRKLNPILLQKFNLEFLSYSETIHSWNHTLSLRTTLRAFQNFVGNISLSDLIKQRVIEFVEIRLKSVSNYAVKRDIANLSSAFSYGISKMYLSENLTKGVKKPRIIERVPLFFSDREFDLIIEHTKDNDLKDLFLFAINTGLRQSDIVSLGWAQIH